jgi:hypothetical protein
MQVLYHFYDKNGFRIFGVVLGLVKRGEMATWKDVKYAITEVAYASSRLCCVKLDVDSMPVAPATKAKKKRAPAKKKTAKAA